MISQETIQEAVRRLVKAYNPLTIYLFGAYAWGTPDDDDLNILVIIESSNEPVHKRGYKAFSALLGLEIPTNVIVFTKEEFDKFSQDVTSSTYEVKSRGKIVYARGE
jgi:uncharacterized protein